MARRDHPVRVPVRDRPGPPGRHPGRRRARRRPDDRHARAGRRRRVPGRELEPGWTVEARLEGRDEPLRAEAAEHRSALARGLDAGRPEAHVPQRGRVAAVGRRGGDLGGRPSADGAAPRRARHLACRAARDRALVGRAARRCTACRSCCAAPTAASPSRPSSGSASGGSRSSGSTSSINGARVFIRGVNRHDFDQHTGRIVTRDQLRGRPGADEAVRVQRRADLALPQRPGPPRADRRARAVRRRRGGHRVARVPEHAVRRPALPRGVGRPRVADGDPRQEPPLGHPLVARQRVRPRPEPRGGGGLAAALRPVAPAPLRGRDPLRLDERPGDHRRDLPDVPADLRDRRARPVGPAAPPADHVRVPARDGQQQRDARRVLGRDRVDAGAPGRVHLGVLGPRPRPAPARRDRALGLRR